MVGALIVRDGRLFAHQRSFDRKLFPGCWDVAGGHVEDGEGLYDALFREVQEETGWEVDEVLGLAKVFEWPKGDKVMREYDFLVTVKGRAEPQLEAGKVCGMRWIAEYEAEILDENCAEGDYGMRLIFEAGFVAMRKLGIAVADEKGR